MHACIYFLYLQVTKLEAHFAGLSPRAKDFRACSGIVQERFIECLGKFRGGLGKVQGRLRKGS